MKKLCMAAMVTVVLLACSEKKKELTLSGLKKADFAVQVEGKAVALFALKNKKGAEACITNYGGRLVSLMVPDKNGKMTDVVLGYDNINAYTASDGNYGALIGRYGNRIANGKFALGGVEYTLPQNDNGHCLHGGPKGYHACVWDAKQVNEQVLVLTYLSPDGEAGFPGNVNIKVTYTLTDDNAIDITYEATTDKETVINLTNHSYFNLAADHSQSILDHTIYINADTYTPVDATLIPTGEFPALEGTPMDLRRPIVIGNQIDNDFDQLVMGRGFDHNWVLNTKGNISQLAAKVVCPTSGIGLEVYTNEPGVQFYSGNFMTEDKGKHGVIYNHRGALCLETQHYPDSPNQPNFPTTVVKPGETYKSRCIYKLTVEK